MQKMQQIVKRIHSFNFIKPTKELQWFATATLLAIREDQVKVKTYLSRGAREELVSFLALMGFAEDFNKTWSKRGDITPNESKQFGEHIENFYDTVGCIMARLDNSVIQRVYKDAQSMEILCLSKERAKIKQIKENEANKSVTIERELLDSLCESLFLKVCNSCEETDEENCKTRKVFRLLDFPPYDCESKRCEFCVSKKRGRKKKKEPNNLKEGCSKNESNLYFG